MLPFDDNCGRGTGRTLMWDRDGWRPGMVDHPAMTPTFSRPRIKLKWKANVSNKTPGWARRAWLLHSHRPVRIIVISPHYNHITKSWITSSAFHPAVLRGLVCLKWALVPRFSPQTSCWATRYSSEPSRNRQITSQICPHIFTNSSIYFFSRLLISLPSWMHSGLFVHSPRPSSRLPSVCHRKF